MAASCWGTVDCEQGTLAGAGVRLIPSALSGRLEAYF